MTVPAHCVRSTTDSQVKVSENGRSFALKNRSALSVELVVVDGCAISTGERCDYLYRFSGKEAYVELKGADIKKAVDQIDASVRQLSAVDKVDRLAFIVSSRVPKEDSSTMLAKLRLLRDLVATLKVKNGSIEHVVG